MLRGREETGEASTGWAGHGGLRGGGETGSRSAKMGKRGKAGEEKNSRVLEGKVLKGREEDKHSGFLFSGRSNGKEEELIIRRRITI